MLKEAGIGTYILFQETYHRDSYLELHPTGPKQNYEYHTEAMDRAMEGGIDDVGLGVLFGLERYKYEFAGLLMHAEHLEAVHGVGPHTISVPRLKRADDIDPDTFDNGIDDETFLKIIACIRIAVPYTGMIISTRESQQVREKALQVGISQISGASRTSVGGYTEEERPHDSEQFDVSDQRTLDEVVHWLMELGFLPSFCTACYREGRTGDRFMSLCKNGQIQNCCHPNALMTLTEFLTDYASEETKQTGFALIEKELQKIPNEKVRAIAAENVEAIRASNRRSFRFRAGMGSFLRRVLHLWKNRGTIRKYGAKGGLSHAARTAISKRKRTGYGARDCARLSDHPACRCLSCGGLGAGKRQAPSCRCGPGQRRRILRRRAVLPGAALFRAGSFIAGGALFPGVIGAGGTKNARHPG